MNIFGRLFSWLGQLFRSDRADLIKKILPIAIAVVRRIASRDWDKDGAVESARDELIGLLGRLPAEVLSQLFAEYLDPSGGSYLVKTLPVRVLKKVLGIALLAESLILRAQTVPAYGILDTATQLAYESTQKDHHP